MINIDCIIYTIYMHDEEYNNFNCLINSYELVFIKMIVVITRYTICVLSHFLYHTNYL